MDRIERLHAFDQETWKIVPGLLAPRIVCLSHMSRKEGPSLVVGADILATARRLLDSDRILVGANLAFDFACLAAADPFLLPLIFRAYAESRVHDVQICQALDAIAGGHLGLDPKTMKRLRAADGRETGRYSLYSVTLLVLGRDDAKSKAVYRTSYGLFDVIPVDGCAVGPLGSLPVERWPSEAREYPLDDVRNPLEIAEKQLLGWTRGGMDDYDGPARNMQNLSAQCEAAFALHLGACWGLRTDRGRIEALSEAVEARHKETVVRFQQKGWIRKPCDKRCGRCDGCLKAGTEDQAAVKRAVASAYGAEGACLRCEGAGKITKYVQEVCRGEKLRGRFQGCLGVSCSVCRGVGRVVRAGNEVTCKVVEASAEEIARTGNAWVAPGDLWGCDGTGLDLNSAELLPRSDKHGVKTDRDSGMESGDDDLSDFSENETEKIRSTYLPYVRRGLDRPLTLNPNALVASGRCSYDTIHQFPRKGGVRETVRARGKWSGAPEDYVIVSTDYAAGELCALAQVTLWWCEESKMLELINATQDPGSLHTKIAAQMLGLSLEEAQARVKAGDKQAKDFRQASKCASFGFPGGLGSATLVLTNRRKNAGSTTAPDGFEYAGIRFCVLMGGAERCGTQKITKWNWNDCPPVCKACVKIVEEVLKPAFFKAYPEVKKYLQIISDLTNDGKPIPALVWDKDRGEVVVLRERGGCGFTDGANQGFQGLLSDAFKRAFSKMTREGYLGTKPDGSPSPLFGTRFVVGLHDEPLAESPLRMLHESGPRIAELMIEAGRDVAPDVYWKAEPAAMYYWSKDAETAFDESGKLIPWEPKS